MDKIFKLLLFSFLLVSLSSCIELIEDTTLNSDGSGSYKLTLNFSSSTTRINSIMAMDTLAGKKVPTQNELQLKMQEYLTQLDSKKGISDVKGTLNTESWIIKIELNFESLSDFKKGITALVQDISKDKPSENVYNIQLSYENHTYLREFGSFIPKAWQEKVQSDKDFGRLNEGKCVFIQRFDQEVAKVSSKEARISKNKKAVMLQLTPIEIVNNPKKLDYTIEIAP